MIKTAFAAALLAAFAFALQDDLGAIVDGAEKSKKSTRKLTPEQVKAIVAATGAKAAEIDAPVTVLEGWAPIPDLPDKGRVVATTVTLPRPKGAIRLGVAVSVEDDRIVAVKVLENKDDPAASSPELLGQFAGFAWTDSARAGVDERKAALEKAKGDPEASALVATSVEMRKVGGLWGALDAKVAKGDKTGTQEAAEIAKIYEDLAARSGTLSFLNARQRDTLKADLLKGAKALRGLAPDGSDASKKAAADVATTCSRCHGSLPNRFRDARAKRGLGNGYFSPDLDLAVPAGASRELVEALGRAVHQAVLKLRDAR